MKPTPQSTEQVFTLYHDNDISKAYKISPYELHHGLLDWLYNKVNDRTWIENTPNDLIFAKYLTEHLNSVYDTFSEFKQMVDLMKPAFKKYHNNWC